MTKKSFSLQDLDLEKIFILGTIALLVLNLVLVFLPFVEVYQPSQSVTILGQTTYEGWYTQRAPMALFIFPLVVTALPYIISLCTFKKSGFAKMLNGTLNKPAKFRLLKFGAVMNLLMMAIFYFSMQDQVYPYVKHGAYCKLNFFGWVNIIFTLVFLVALFILSFKSKTACRK